MAWVDAMRLRRKADIVRALGWVNLFASILLSFVHLSDGLVTLGLLALWAVAVMTLTHGIAWIVDRRAERVVTR